MAENQFQNLVSAFSQLPGIGKKSATRIGFHLLRMEEGQFLQWVQSIQNARDLLGFCNVCGGLSEEPICEICTSQKRNSQIVCVVEQPEDIFFIENTKEFFGKYHVLNGSISPLDGMGPDQLRIKELLIRIEKEEIKEILIATNPTLEGDATASYLSELIKERGVLTTRIAHGITIGGSIEYSDQYTLGRAIRARLTM